MINYIISQKNLIQHKKFNKQLLAIKKMKTLMTGKVRMKKK